MKKTFAYATMPLDKKRLQVHLDKRMKPQTVLPYSLGILLFFYSGKKPTSTMKIKSFIYSRRIIVSDTRKKIDGVAVATARFSDAVAGQLNK